MQRRNNIALAAAFGYASLLCCLCVWIEAVVQFELRPPRYEAPLRRWVATLVLSIIFAGAAAIRGQRGWALALLWPIGTLLLLSYIVGS